MPTITPPLTQTGSTGIEYTMSTVAIATDAKAGDVVATVTVHYPDGWYEQQDGFILDPLGGADDESKLLDGTTFNGVFYTGRPIAIDPETNTITFELKLYNDVSGSVLTQDFYLEFDFIGYSEDGNTEYHDNVTFLLDLGGDGVPLGNSAPEAIELSNTTVSEANRAGFVVGMLSATDPEGDNDGYFTLVTNEGPISHSSWTIR